MKKVLILFGGCSSEHEVSLRSASSVLSNISRDKYEIYMIGITREGKWYLYEGPIDLIAEDKWNQPEYVTPAVVSPDRETHGIVFLKGGVKEKVRIDVAFPVMHGKNGEDGSMQGLFQLAGIPYVGCDLASSAISMDKILTNSVVERNGIKQAKWDYMMFRDFKSPECDNILEKIAEHLKYPIFVKPANAGSSVGISKARNFDELKRATEFAFEHDDRVLFEETIIGYEVECAVLGNDNPITGVPGQVVPANEFYDYEAKYENANSLLYIPAKISEDKLEAISKEAIKVYKSLYCSGFTRVDFFVGKEDGEIYFNEVNNIPGFTPISMYPKMMDAAGVSYPELCDRLIELAEEKWG